jgi:hypothetical protein
MIGSHLYNSPFQQARRMKTVNVTGTKARGSDGNSDSADSAASEHGTKSLKNRPHPTGFEPVASAFGGQANDRPQRRNRLKSGSFGAEQAVNRGVRLGLSELSSRNAHSQALRCQHSALRPKPQKSAIFYVPDAGTGRERGVNRRGSYRAVTAVAV